MGVLTGVRQVAGRAVARMRAALPQPVKRGTLEYVGPVRGSGGLIQTRASAVGRLLAMLTGGKNVPQRSVVRYEINAKEGYEKNPIVYRCIRLVQEALKAMPLLAYTVDGEGKETELPANHPLRVVLDSPNPAQTLGDLLDEIVGHTFLAGEFFLEGVTLDRTQQLVEIYALRPDRMTVVPGDDGLPLAHEFEAATGKHRFERVARGFSPILHVKQWNPRDHWRGLPIVAPAAAPADEYSEAVQQNRSLLNNSVMPSGALVYAPKEGQGNLSDEQFERLKAELDEEHTGPGNHGKPLILDNMNWQPMGMTPKDSMAVEQRNQAAREAALALGVPPLVLGLPGDNTYANYAEANSAFWRQTVWPLAMFLSDKLTRWVRPIAGANVRIAFDREASPMAEEERAARWQRVGTADCLTLDEKRGELGYAAYEKPKDAQPGSHILVASSLSILEDVILGEPDPVEAGALAYGKNGENDDA
jgi:HK97 family phage portal protein